MGVAVARIAGVRLPGEVSLERPSLARRWPAADPAMQVGRLLTRR